MMQNTGCYRFELNTKFVKKGLDATKTYKKITEAQWKAFVEQKTSEDFLSKSEANSELAKKNKYHHRLGTGGYKRQILKIEGRRSYKESGRVTSAI
jgi:hypothetical protein